MIRRAKPRKRAPTALVAPAWGQAPETPKLRVSTIPIAGMVPLYTANKLGYFKNEGLEVSIEFAAGGAQSLPLVVQGTLQLSNGPIVSVALAAGHVPVERHRRHAQLPGEPAHGERGQALGVEGVRGVEELHVGLVETGQRHRLQLEPVLDVEVGTGHGVDRGSVRAT